MENNNSFDWLAVSTQAQDKSMSDIFSMGVDPSNTTLKSKDFYKKSDKIQEMFKTPEGDFDAKRFDAFYLEAEKSFNEYKKADFDLGSVAYPDWDDSNTSRPIKAKNPIKLSLTSKTPFTNLRVAQQSYFGLSEINKWSAPQKTYSEVAQGQKVLDGLTGKELDYTPEDTGLFNLFGFFSEPLVMATHDSDGVDPITGEKFKKGDYKYDKNGLPRYETLAGRDVAGKQQLSRWNTMSKEGSFENKFDFMDTDGFDKSFTGLAVKTAVELAPLFFGNKVSAAYKAYYIASGLVTGGAEITKALDAIYSGPGAKSGSLYKFANNLQGYTGQFKSTVSDYGRENFMGLESLASLAVDSVYQLMGQRALAQWPSDIKKYQLAKQLDLKTKGLYNAGDEATKGLFEIENYITKYGDDWVKAAQGLSSNVKTLEKYGKYSSYMATAYMAATSAVGISQVSEMAGLDARDKGFMYLGYMSALAPLFRTNIGNWVEKGLDVDDLAKGINKATKDYASKYLPGIAIESAKDVAVSTAKGRAVAALKSGKELGNHIVNLYRNLDVNSVGTAALAEGTEELSESVIQTALQGIYNTLSAAGIRSSQEGTQFSLEAGDIAEEYLQNFVGGAMGGAIFKKLTPRQENVFKSDNMKEYVTEGHGLKVIQKIEELKEKGELGSTTLSINPLTDEDGNVIPEMWKPVNEENPISQNDFIADRMIKEVKVNEAQRAGFNVMPPNETAEGKNKFFQALVDTRTDTDLRDRIHDTVNKMYELGRQIQSIDGVEGESQEGLLELKTELNLLKKELEYLQGDESVDEYFRQGLFNIRTDINSKFGVKTRQTITEELIGKNRKYRELSAADKGEVDVAYDKYREEEIKDDLKTAHLEYVRFNENMEKSYPEIEVFKQSLIDLEKYAEVREIAPIEGMENPLMDITPIRNYVQQLKAVKYIPDFMYDKIKANLDSLATVEASKFLNILRTDPETFVLAIEKGLKNTNVIEGNPFYKGLIDKAFGNKFQEFKETPEFIDVFENKQKAGDYSILKVLKTIAENSTPNNKILEYREFVQEVESLTNEDLLQLIRNIKEDASHPVNALLEKKGFIDTINQYSNEMDLSLEDLIEETPLRDLIKRFVKFKTLGELTDVDMPLANLDGYLSQPSQSNLFVELLVEGEFRDGDVLINTEILNALPTQQLEMDMEFAREFDQERLNSPLREILKQQYEFMESEMANLELVGHENYLNSDEAFGAALDAYIASVEKVGALVDAAREINPLINDFRKTHGSILPDNIKGIELFELSDTDASVLISEINRMSNTLKYLREINEYNKNNVLAKLLREDGLILASNFLTWKHISAQEDIARLLPSISNIYANEDLILYAANPVLANEESKFKALEAMAKFEHSIFEDFQKLNQADKLRLVNSTFSPIDPRDEAFTEIIDGTKPLNSYHQAIYMAKVFGTSSLEFYKHIAGDWDSENEVFTNIQKAYNTPFPIQENAIRLAYFVKNADPLVKRWLFNAYTYAEDDDRTTFDFSKQGAKSISTENMVGILGDPGTGKTTAVTAGFLSTTPDAIGDVVLLAPKARQLASLMDSVTKSGYEGRINTDSSRTVTEFLESLPLKDKAGKSLDFAAIRLQVNSITEYTRAKGESIYSLDSRIKETINNKIADIFKDINIYLEKTDTIITLKETLATKLSTFKYIILDEFTHVNPIDLGIINHLINEWNRSSTVEADPSKAITIVVTGDVNQMGFTVKGESAHFQDFTNIMVSTPLTTSLRSGWDLVNNPQIDIKRRTYKVKGATADELGSTDLITQMKQPIKLHSNISPENGSIGISSVTKVGSTTVSDLQFITQNKARFTGKDVVYVVNDLAGISEAEALMKEAIGPEWRNYVDIYTPDEVQGGEYKYAIIDATPKLVDQDFDIRRTFEFLNTMLSRATEATLLVDNGSMNKYVTLENVVKDKAIMQKRLTDEMRDKIKENKETLVRSILQGYESTVTPDEPVEDQSVEEKETKPKTKKAKDKEVISTPKMPVIKASKLASIFDDKMIVKDKVVSIPGITNDGERPTKTTKPTDVIAYTTFSTAEDFDKLRKLMFSKDDATPNDEAIELVIASYKYYLNNRKDLSSSNLTLNNNFVDYFQDYDYAKPTYYMEVAKVGEKNATTGRAKLGTYKQEPDSLVFMLKVKLPSVVGGEPLILTYGTLRDIHSIRTSQQEANNPLGVEFARQVIDYVKGENGSVPPNRNISKGGQTVNQLIGIAEAGTWRSHEFDQEQFDDMAIKFGSRIKLDSKTNVGYDSVREAYPDFVMTKPQVVVVSNLEDDIKGGSSKDAKETYERVWSRLKGKSVSLVTDMHVLRNKTPQQLLDIYFKQLELFNNPEFLNLTPEQKDFRIKEIAEQGVTIPLDNKPNTTNVLAYKPNMVKLIKLDNPKAHFMLFREKVINEIQKKKVNKDFDIKEGFKQFDMPVYVKDRLIKSLMVIHKFLQIKENQEWFDKNVLSKHLVNTQERLDNIRAAIAEVEGWDFANSIDPDNISAIGKANNQALFKLTTSDFSIKLDDLLYNQENKLIRGYYNNSQAQEEDLVTDFKKEELALTLSNDKVKDFSDYLLSVNAFQLLFKTKNVNFAELIELSLAAFSEIPLDHKTLGKYSLKKVFGDEDPKRAGEIESVVIAADNSATPGWNYATNMLAEASQFTNGFTFNFGGLQTPAWNFDFDKLYDMFEGNYVKIDTDTIDSQVEENWYQVKEKFAELQNTSVHSSLFDIQTPTSQLQIEEVLESIGSEDKVALKSKVKTKLKVNDIVAYKFDKEGVTAKLTLKDYVLEVLEESNPELDVLQAEVQLKSSTTKAAILTLTTDNVELEVEFDLATGEVKPIVTGVSTTPVIGEEVDEQQVKGPMDTIQKIEKEELRKYDTFIEDTFSEALLGIDAIKEYTEMYKELYRLTVVKANIAGTDITLAEYDPELAQFEMNLPQWNMAKNAFLNQNKTMFRGAQEANLKLVRLIKQYKTTC